MNIIEIYQNHYPNLPKSQLLTLIANEGFLRRMSAYYEPFMLKGSFVSRTYFENPAFRMPNDLDFVYFGNVKEPEKAEQVFTDWADGITQTPIDDGIIFEKFSKNDHWEGVDYEMHQDFPTVNGFCKANILGNDITIDLDISFNLELLAEPIEILYPTLTDIIYLPYSVPLPIQIAWKIHQGIINPRLKDFYDLSYLLPLLNRPDDITLMLDTLKSECERDYISQDRIKQFFDAKNSEIFSETVWINHKFKLLSNKQLYENEEYYQQLKQYCPNIPKTFDEFWQFYRQSTQKTIGFFN